MDAYKYGIGFFNGTIEDSSGLEKCDIIFSDYIELEKHLRYGDVVIVKSFLSLYGVSIQTLEGIIKDKSIEFKFLDSINSANDFNIMTVRMACGFNEFVKENLKKIKHLPD